MFVRVVRKDVDGEPTPAAESLYQCRRLHVREMSDDCELDLEGPSTDAISMTVKKQATIVYVMNDDGKTIDTHRWS